MTILVGAFSRSTALGLPESLCSDLTRNLSRNPDDEVTCFRDGRCLLAKVDIGAFGEPAFRIEKGRSVSMLAGEPLLAAADVPFRSRTADLDLLHRAWDQGDWSALSQCQGVFCGAHYDARAGRITLFTDKLRVRSLYYWHNEDLVVFASALRILEAIPAVPKEMSLQGVAELATLGYTLGDHTAYVRVKGLRAGETVRFTEHDMIRARYWRWDAVDRSDLDEQERLRLAAQRFTEAVDRRLRRDSTTTVFLSGGLDSRTVVASLRQRGTLVHTLNFDARGLPATQDSVFAAQFARVTGTLHHQVPVDLTIGTIQAQLTWALSQHAWTASDQWARWPPQRPQLMWTGNGGSTGVGLQSVSRRIAHLLRSGDRAAAIEAFFKLDGSSILHHIWLQSDVAPVVGDLLAQGIAAELDDLRCGDPARALYLFLMVNDQPGHLAWLSEEVDIHRAECLTPFFDSRFLEIVLSAPVDVLIDHGWYMKWLRHLPQIITAVPWQTLPGHAPCPLPVPKDLSYQWHPKAARELAQQERKWILGLAKQVVGSEQFPDAILRRRRLRWAYRLFRARLREWGPLFKSAEVYHRYFARSRGRFSVAPLS